MIRPVRPGSPRTSGSVWVTELDAARADAIGETLEAPTLQHVLARVLVRVHGEPIGIVQQPLVSGRLLVSGALAALPPAEQARMAELLALGAPRVPKFPLLSRLTPPGTPAVSVVVCTRDRGDALRTVLADLQSLDERGLPGGFGVVVVDNAPSDESGRKAFEAQVGQDLRFHYVREARPGLSCARNRGLAEVRSPLLAYTDDDVRVDAGWLTGLAKGFERRADIGCVTGAVLTASLDTPAERYFDARVSWADGCSPAEYDLSSHPEDPLYPYAAGRFGTGASMAFRTQLVRDLGGFDEALGAGTATRGGEDLDMFLRVLVAGYALVREPAGLVWHRHRSDMAGLRKQIFGYGSGLTAYGTKLLLLGPRRRRILLRLVRPALKRALTVTRSSKRDEMSGGQALLAPTAGADGSPAGGPAVVAATSSLPTGELRLRELAGMALGPLLYLRARRAVAQGSLLSRPAEEDRDHAYTGGS